jgi:hypothetical protein
MSEAGARPGVPGLMGLLLPVTDGFREESVGDEAIDHALGEAQTGEASPAFSAKSVVRQAHHERHFLIYPWFDISLGEGRSGLT